MIDYKQVLIIIICCLYPLGAHDSRKPLKLAAILNNTIIPSFF